jgi:hypothetical protein
LAIVHQGNRIAELRLADLQRLPQASIILDGKKQSGPSVSAVLENLGISSFDMVTVVGKTKGRLASRELRLRKDQLTDAVLFDLTNRGTAKLVSPDLPSELWIVDAGEVIVE